MNVINCKECLRYSCIVLKNTDFLIFFQKFLIYIYIREISELHEEIATMQTLYQYRTYSVDSSEEESDNDQGDTKEQRVEKLKLLNKLSKEKKELEDKKLTLQTKLAEEREACLRLRVNIRLEQERIKRQKLSQFPGIGFGKVNWS